MPLVGFRGVRDGSSLPNPPLPNKVYTPMRMLATTLGVVAFTAQATSQPFRRVRAIKEQHNQLGNPCGLGIP